MKTVKTGTAIKGWMVRAGLLLASLPMLWGCGQAATSGLDTSGAMSESASATVGGALNSTSGDSVALNDFTIKKSSVLDELIHLFTPIDESFAFTKCPTVLGSASGCSASANAITLTYPTSGCTFDNSSAIWVGGSELTVEPTSYAAQCGTFPYLDGTDVTSVTRTYLGSIPGGNPTARTNRNGTVTVALDTTSSTGWEYAVPGTGYTRTFVSQSGSGSSYQATHTLAIGINEVAYSGSLPSGTKLYDHTLSTTDSNGNATPLQISVSIVSGSPNANRQNQLHTVNGTLYLQHNLAKYTAAATFTNAVHEFGCCYPISGTIVTTFTGGPNNGKSETLDFDGGAACNLGTLGQVQFTDVNGNTSTKTLTHCL